MRGNFFYWAQHRKLVIVCLFLIFIGEQIPGFSQPSEYLVKAVLLEKFTRFIEWPENSPVIDSTDSFVIGILGKNPFDVDLNAVYQNRKIKNKQVEIQYYEHIDDVDQCHLLFIAKSERNRIHEIVDMIGGEPILTIGDSDDFSGKGVIINISISNKKMRFEIDEQAVQRAGFHVSYLLLKEAELVNSN
ncbi:YfiR family protein [bacterium]